MRIETPQPACNSGSPFAFNNPYAAEQDTSTAPVMPPAKPGGKLDDKTFSEAVAAVPLIAIDLIVEDSQGNTLLGMRSNPPAKDYWFVPGGRIRKNESLCAAFERLTVAELGRQFHISGGRLLGVFEHFYDTDFTGRAGVSTHYVVLAYQLRLDEDLSKLPGEQHTEYRWFASDEALHRPDVHRNTQIYFLNR